ncbi:MAG: cobalamin-dependent protein [Pseudomonadota bacterium]
MSDADQGASSLQDDIYLRTFDGFRTLRRRLPEDALGRLAREVILRLAAHPVATAAEIDAPSESDIAELSRALLEPEPAAGKAFIARIRAEGATLETVYLAYLRRAALQLGTWWEADKITFADVTVGTGHIFSIMRGLSHLFVPNGVQHHEKEALFSVVPGETHVMGLRMAADLFRKDGWTITLAADLGRDALIEEAVHGNHQIIGLSAAGKHALTELAQTIVALRISAPHALIFVGGNVIANSKGIVSLMGPDAMASDYEGARDEMARLDALNAARQAKLP